LHESLALQDGFRSNDIADMTAGSLSTLFSWAALICTLAGAISTGVALHYRNVSSKEKDFEIASIGLEAAKSNEDRTFKGVVVKTAAGKVIHKTPIKSDSNP
jgi:hypothetical protein